MPESTEGRGGRDLLEIEPSTLSGMLKLPPSKSHSMRWLTLASMDQSPTKIEMWEVGEDVQAMIDCLTRLGIVWDGLVMTGGKFKPPTGVLDCKNSGTALRFLIAQAATCDFAVTLDGDASLRADRSQFRDAAFHAHRRRWWSRRPVTNELLQDRHECRGRPEQGRLASAAAAPGLGINPRRGPEARGGLDGLPGRRALRSPFIGSGMEGRRQDAAEGHPVSRGHGIGGSGGGGRRRRVRRRRLRPHGEDARPTMVGF